MAVKIQKSYHECMLPVKDTSGLPKLPPNAALYEKFFRKIRRLFILNPNHFKCKTMFRNRSAIMEERKRHATSRYFYVIHPLSTFNMLLEALFFLTWTYSLLCGPLTIWLEKFDLMQEKVILPIRLVVIALLFNVGYIDTKAKLIIIESRKIVVKYLKTYFIFDLLSCYWLDEIGDLILKSDLNIPESVAGVWFEVILVIRTTACCVRINTLMSFLDNTLTTFKFNQTVRILLCYVVRTYIYIHIISVILFLTPYLVFSKKLPESSWLYQANITNIHEDHGNIYLESLLLSTCYFFGVSYKYEILLLVEQAILACASFSGRLYTLYLLADVLRVFGIAGVSESMYERNMYVLQQYMTDKDLPSVLQTRMLKFFEFKFQRRYFKDTDIINTLSDTLRTELFLFSARKLIQKVDMLKRLPNATVGAIIASMRAETYSPRDIIIKLGWEINDIYFISTGTVAVMDKQGLELCHLEDGENFGINCLVAREQTHSVMAVETTEVFIISKNELMGFLHPYPDMLSKFIRTAKQKLAYYKDLEAAIGSETVDVLSELQRGHILERRSKRLQVY